MLSWTIAFLVIALIAAALGFGGVEARRSLRRNLSSQSPSLDF
jgi:hypothetical protein